jgi:hypothetical protein
VKPELKSLRDQALKDTRTIVIHTAEVLTAKDSSSIEGIWLEPTKTIGLLEFLSSTLLAHRGQVAITLSFWDFELSKNDTIEVTERLLRWPLPASFVPAESGK